MTRIRSIVPAMLGDVGRVAAGNDVMGGEAGGATVVGFVGTGSESGDVAAVGGGELEGHVAEAADADDADAEGWLGVGGDAG